MLVASKYRKSSTPILPLAASRTRFLQARGKIRYVLSLVQVLVSRLDEIRSLLSDHVDRVLDAAVGDNRNHRGVDDTKVLDAVNGERRIDDTLADSLRETGSATGV